MEVWPSPFTASTSAPRSSNGFTVPRCVHCMRKDLHSGVEWFLLPCVYVCPVIDERRAPARASTHPNRDAAFSGVRPHTSHLSSSAPRSTRKRTTSRFASAAAFCNVLLYLESQRLISSPPFEDRLHGAIVSPLLRQRCNLQRNFPPIFISTVLSCVQWIRAYPFFEYSHQLYTSQ
jgi:hypothetical protein